MKSVFISYSLGDTALVEGLRDQLSKNGFEVFDAARSINVGETWSDSLRNAIRDSAVVVAVVPVTATAGSNAVFAQVGAARALGRPVVIVTPDDHQVSRQIPTNLADFIVMRANSAKHSMAMVADTVARVAS